MKIIDSIIVQHVLSNRSDAMVWAVYVQSTKQEMYKTFCKSPQSAMRYAFLLKYRTGVNISENCLARLSHELRHDRKAKAKKIQKIANELAEKYSVNNLLHIGSDKPLPRTNPKVVKSTKLGVAHIIGHSEVAASV